MRHRGRFVDIHVWSSENKKKKIFFFVNRCSGIIVDEIKKAVNKVRYAEDLGRRPRMEGLQRMQFEKEQRCSHE